MLLTQEQEELRAYVRSFLAQHSPTSEIYRIYERPGEFDSVLWRRMATELGLQGIGCIESMGGCGGSWVELGIVFEELGRALTPCPYFAATALAIPTLVMSDDQRAAETWLPQIIAGQCVATVAIPDVVSGLTDTPVHARADGGEFLLCGRAPVVVEGGGAQLAIVPAECVDGVGNAELFVVTGNAHGVARTQLTGVDGTLRFAALEFAHTPATKLCTSENAYAVIDRVTDLAYVAVAAIAVGGARACLDAVVDYAKVRTQFHRQIGGFQAVKHRLADLAVAVESAAGLAQRAARLAANEDESLPLVASLAKAHCCEIYVRAAAENIQLHGGIGFTWEHTAHLHYRRAVVLQDMMRSNSFHTERAAELLGMPESWSN
ncbi:acyl-CoA/acyl-ACP dehydrogenase [Mycolicibacterium pulveris]|uniref:Acyl-CoA dehydrogenase n=1 Tax=Mycolicibacterium pulveris TaxID=36813 RepID=A0A7I7US72_MYCPV|nr:acyl-CoA dehydrogenase family protein [Mycolicibacterium pulveris]MCV6983559.1 acyl-CoA/acyl-ACP dehydrogenase [Mycolicibacterium pulveris]BBY83439.1 acyl-CoA dehydrogenase [Mycolicibacterium pulveris]